jgi:hypothetical protein
VWFTQDEFQKIGQITLSIGLDHFLVKLHTEGQPPYNEIITLSDLADAMLFDTRSELDEFLAWCEKAEDRPALKLVTTPSDDREPA